MGRWENVSFFSGSREISLNQGEVMAWRGLENSWAYEMFLVAFSASLLKKHLSGKHVDFQRIWLGCWSSTVTHHCLTIQITPPLLPNRASLQATWTSQMLHLWVATPREAQKTTTKGLLGGSHNAMECVACRYTPGSFPSVLQNMGENRLFEEAFGNILPFWHSCGPMNWIDYWFWSAIQVPFFFF